MKIKKLIILALVLSPQFMWAQKINPANGLGERAYLVKTLTKIADPVLLSLSKNELKKSIPIHGITGNARANFTCLEAFGRLLAGMSPWLELGPDDTAEGKLRKKYIDLAILGIKNATDPKAADFMNFKEGAQPLVDAAFFAQALLRSPKQLWGNLDAQTKKNVIEALKSTRVITPSVSNWLMFSATVEAALLKYDNSYDKTRIDFAIKKHLLWYKGDGIYGDGVNFHWDYYNGFVIQPMLVEVTKVMQDANVDSLKYHELMLKRAQRYAVVQERFISPEATYPVIGRSITYRFGAFQVLAKIALMKALPTSITPQQVRSALYAVIKRQIEMPNTFDKDGWLNIGFAGHQPNMGEHYISTGSLYLCSEGFLMLGLPADDVLWTAPYADWTSKKAWNGEDVGVDKAISEKPN